MVSGCMANPWMAVNHCICRTKGTANLGLLGPCPITSVTAGQCSYGQLSWHLRVRCSRTTSSIGLHRCAKMQEHPETASETATATATAVAPRTASLELVKELPRGSVGVVHQARNPQQNRSVALRKFEVPEWLDDADDRIKKIVAEAKTAGALDHPNIARLYTCGYKDFTVFMTAEFIEGQTLRELMAKRQPEMGEVLQLSKQLLAALDHAHSRGVFHNFLNPNNIKILPDSTIKILDFGLLRDKNLLTQTPTK